jgi:peptidoglycan/LPS O-acetylase OafA/YrhL
MPETRRDATLALRDPVIASASKSGANYRLHRSMMISPQRQNNFDLIRLLAATQVVLAHAIGHTELLGKLPPWGRQVFDALMLLPGVPVFFVISGFLITQSFERKPTDLKGYFWRRSLRIFPGLWVCLMVTLAALGFYGFLGTDFVLSKTFAAWLAGQVSLFQFYNPEHFRGFGIGVANGALWTITVELQFYAFVPIYHWLSGDRKPAAMISVLMFLVSFAAYCVMDHQVNGPGGFTGAPTAFKLLHVTLIPHLWMFMLGILIHRRFETLRPWLEGKFLWYLAAYALFMAALHTLADFRSVPFYLGYLPARALLALGTISAAFSARSLSTRLLHGMDLSYGTYLYHSVVINVFVELGLMNTFAAVIYIFIASIILALLSWHGIEKPALARKSFSPSALWTRRSIPAGSDP